MKVIKHRFLDHKINPETEILILGTFNPDTEKNEADFFYGRSHNYLWRLLPVAFNKPDLKKASKQEKISFIEQMKIDFVDLIEEIQVKEGDEANYDDAFIDNKVIKWQNIITKIEQLNNLKKILLTRKTDSDIPNMRKQIKIIKDYCNEHNIKFDVLPTPARFYNKKKQENWTDILTND